MVGGQRGDEGSGEWLVAPRSSGQASGELRQTQDPPFEAQGKPSENEDGAPGQDNALRGSVVGEV
jgi:hypothetical protein